MPTKLKALQSYWALSGLSSLQSLNLSPSCSLRRSSARRYATERTSEYSLPSDDDHFVWPSSASPTAIPTPYEIFKQKRGTPYSKDRYYELVKLYHPDRDAHQEMLPGCVARTVRLERYKLIVAANEILSDPAKRRAYDLYGAGWIESSDISGLRYPRPSRNPEAPSYDPDSPMNNGTWEDWERWYQRRAGAKQQPLYVSNGTFVALILFCAIVGSMHEMSRAGRLSQTLLQQLEAIHDESSKDLRRRREDSQLTSHDERMQRFLRTRDPEWSGDRPRREVEAPKASSAPASMR